MDEQENILVFMDRDGTINEERGYIINPKDLEFIQGSDWAIRRLNRYNIKTCVVTNQASVAKKIATIDQIENVNRYMVDKLLKMNAYLNSVHFCPWDKGLWRKPDVGMFNDTMKEMNINKRDYKMYMVGDKLTDIEAGKKFGCRTILVSTGHGKEEELKIESNRHTPDIYSKNLWEAVEIILKENNKI